MAEEVWYVSYDIQEASSTVSPLLSKAEKVGPKSENSFPPVTQETNAINSAGGEGFKSPISLSKNVEVTAGGAAEAIELVRERFGSNAGKCRALAKPNTNFKIAT